MSRPAISKHLRVLERAGLVPRLRDGRVSRCRLDARPLAAAADWHYRRFWGQSFDRLDDYLRQRRKKEKHHGRKT